MNPASSPTTLSAETLSLPRSSPENQGLSSAAIREFVEAADRQVQVMHSVMILRHGHVVAEGWWPPEAPQKPHVMWSLSKSFTSTAVGLAVTEGKLNVDDRVLDFFPEYAPAHASDNLRAMRVRDLLTMTTGHDTQPDLAPDIPWETSFLAHPVPHEPGTHFLYNNAGSHMLSAIVERVTGETTLDFLRPRLFDPLGIPNPQWETNARGATIGGWGLHLRTEEVARFGHLYLQKGRWNGQQLVPEAWVEKATAEQVSNGSDPNSDWNQGYGFQFWRCRHGAYRGDGKDGQFCVVLPKLDAVVVMTALSTDLPAQLSLVWEKLLPAFGTTPLAENAEEAAKLKQTLANLSGPAASKASG